MAKKRYNQDNLTCKDGKYFLKKTPQQKRLEAAEEHDRIMHYCINKLNAHGFLAYHITYFYKPHCPGCNKIFGFIANKELKGLPDIIAFGPSGALFVEVKTGSARLTKEQKEFKDKVEPNYKFYIPRSYADVDTIIATIK